MLNRENRVVTHYENCSTDVSVTDLNGSEPGAIATGLFHRRSGIRSLPLPVLTLSIHCKNLYGPFEDMLRDVAESGEACQYVDAHQADV